MTKDVKKAQEVKIISFTLTSSEIHQAEKELADLLNDDWEIISTAGGFEVGNGFVVVLRRHTNPLL